MIDSLVDLICFHIKRRLCGYFARPHKNWENKEKSFAVAKKEYLDKISLLPQELQERITMIPRERHHIAMFKHETYLDYLDQWTKREEYNIRIISVWEKQNESCKYLSIKYMCSLLIPLFHTKYLNIWYSVTEIPHLSWTPIPGYACLKINTQKHGDNIVDCFYYCCHK